MPSASHGPQISTIILFFNKPAMTLRCLQSTFEALAQTKNGNGHEVVLVDNGSTAQNRKLIESEATSLAMSHQQSIQFLTLTPNQGFGSGMNAGLAHGFENKNHFICALSNDIEVDPHFYNKLYHSLEAAPLNHAASILCPTVYHLIDRQSLAYTHGHCDIDTMTLSHSKNTPPQIIKFPYYYPGAATIWNHQAYATLGGFDSRFFCYWEDVSLSLSATLKGVALVPAPELRVHHLGRGTTGNIKSTSQHFAEGRHRFQQILKTHQPQYVSRHVREVSSL